MKTVGMTRVATGQWIIAASFACILSVMQLLCSLQLDRGFGFRVLGLGFRV